MSQQQQFQMNRPKNLLDMVKLKMYAEKLPEGSRSPTLSIKAVKGNIRIDVYTNVPSDKNKGNIQAAMGWVDFCSFMEQWKDFIDGKADGVTMQNHNYTFFNNKRSETPKHISTTVIRRDKDSGRVYIALIAKDRPKARFFFQSPQFHKFVGAGNETFSEADDSMAYCRGYYRHLDKVAGSVLVAHENLPIEDDERRAKEAADRRGGGGGGNYGGNRGGNNNRSGGGGNYGGGNNNRGGGNGGGNSFDDFDDDIPM